MSADIGIRLYSAEQVRELDRRAIERLGLPGLTLMRRAGRACWAAARVRWPRAQCVDVLCGAGNNGGDGYVVARLAAESGREVRVWTCGEPREGSDAAAARAQWTGATQAWSPGAFSGAQLVFDALFGTGLTRPVEGDARAAIEDLNASDAAVVAVDIPSGLACDNGQVLGAAVKADLTVTFIGRKFGLYTGEGPEHAGECVFADLGVADDHQVPCLARLQQPGELRPLLQRRPRDSHKGRHGHVLIVGGDHGTAGAVLLAARAALHGGAGLVSVATRGAHVAALVAAQPEVMFAPVESAAQLDGLLQRADVVAVGPGLGQQEWGRAMWQRVRAVEQPLIVDADGLNLLAASGPGASVRGNWVLTPHPGEAARLLSRSVREIQVDRLGAVRALQERYGAIAVLKGAGTLVRGGSTSLCPYGNPGMGTGGMGDALTGVVAAIAAQAPALGIDLEQAAQAAVLAHALAGDRAAQRGERGLTVSELIDALREIVNP